MIYNLFLVFQAAAKEWYPDFPRVWSCVPYSVENWGSLWPSLKSKGQIWVLLKKGKHVRLWVHTHTYSNTNTQIVYNVQQKSCCRFCKNQVNYKSFGNDVNNRTLCWCQATHYCTYKYSLLIIVNVSLWVFLLLSFVFICWFCVCVCVCVGGVFVFVLSLVPTAWQTQSRTSIIIDNFTSEFEELKVLRCQACQFRRCDCFHSIDILLVMSLQW